MVLFLLSVMGERTAEKLGSKAKVVLTFMGA